MSRTNDGFEIAEVDLKLRGPGDILGTKQSGLLDLKIADLSKDGQLVSLARSVAKNILKEDPQLQKKEHLMLRKKMIQTLQEKPDWGKIS